MYKKILISAASLLVVTASLGAQAQPFAGRGPVPFGAMDLDGDGYVSSQEFSQHRCARMAARAAQGRLLRNADQAPRLLRGGRGVVDHVHRTVGSEPCRCPRTAIVEE